MRTPSPDRTVVAEHQATSPLRLCAMWLFVVGSMLVCLGGLGDIAYHALPAAQLLEPLVGAEGIRVHILTLAGMVVALAGVLGRGLSR